MTATDRSSRRRFIQTGALGAATLAGVGGIFSSRRAPAQVTSDAERPVAGWGLSIGDVRPGRAIVWSRSDRPARMVVEWSHREDFKKAREVQGPYALEVTDFTSRVDLVGLPEGEEIFVRVSYESLDSARAKSAPVVGRFRTPPSKTRPVRFVWGGDTCGQGWGIDLDKGGMRCYEAMRQVQPDFFIHSGDNIYADGPMASEVTDATGQVVWRNAYLDLVPEKMKVAETLDEFRRAYLYNLYDANVVAFNAEVPQIWQWDDHEVSNNWSDSKVLDGRYTEQHIQSLVARGTRAFLEYAPMRWYSQKESERVYRRIPYSKDLDVFVLDMRSYRAANGCNTEPEPGPETAFLGREQIKWLKGQLARSTATWKVIAADMPIGLNVGDGTDPSGCPRGENSSNGNGPVLGREFEIAEILKFIKDEQIVNTVWLTADVHYCAAHYYDPTVAQFQDFEPFWEFVSGPLHAGSFGPNSLDNTFGPNVVFFKAPPPGQANLPPSAGLQFFGQVDIDPHSKAMVVAFKDIDGAEVFSQRLDAKTSRRHR